VANIPAEHFEPPRVRNEEVDATVGALILPDQNNVSTNSKFNCIIERIGYPLDGLGHVTTITKIYPHMDGPGSCYIQVGSMDFPGSPIRWKPAVLFNPETDRKIDIRTTGELHCFRILDMDVEVTWRITGLDVEYVEAGLR
jgi:hypothetical protein